MKRHLNHLSKCCVIVNLKLFFQLWWKWETEKGMRAIFWRDLLTAVLDCAPLYCIPPPAPLPELNHDPFNQACSSICDIRQ